MAFQTNGAMKIPIERVEDAQEFSGRFARFGEITEVARLPARTLDGARVTLKPTPLPADQAGSDLRISMDIYEVQPSASPIKLHRLERHPLSFQTFVPLTSCSLVVAVCPAGRDGKPDLPGLSAFLIESGRIVTYHRGVWHMSVTCVRESAQLAMTMYKRGIGDTEFCNLSEPLFLHL